MFMHMIRAKSWLLRRAALAALCCAVLGLPGAQAEPGSATGPQAAVPERPLLPNAEANTAAARRELLGELYHRLREAENQDSAELIASAIEQLWLRSGSDTIDLLMSRAGILIAGERFDTALRILNSVVELAPDYPEGWSRRAEIFFVKKEIRKSLDDLRHVLALDPSHYKAIQGLGLLMREVGDDKAALQAIRKVLKVHPYLEDARQAEQELSREVEGQGI